MRVSFGRIATLLLLVVSAGCGPFIARPRADEDIITRQEIDRDRFLTAYDAVQALHSNWLIVKPKTLSTNNPVTVIVYLDDNRMPGGVDDLSGIESQRIQYIRHYDPIAATQRWGIGHTEGAIQVSTQPM